MLEKMCALYIRLVDLILADKGLKRDGEIYGFHLILCGDGCAKLI